jgi:hypothetical protein
MWRRKWAEMSESGISNCALVRAADAMLRALGGAEITLLFAAATLPNDPSAQLGLVDPGVEQVNFCPVIARNLVTPNTGPRRRLEFLISASVVASEVVTRNAASAEALFDSSLGLMYDGDIFHIELVTTEYFDGMAYLYRVMAVE